MRTSLGEDNLFAAEPFLPPGFLVASIVPRGFMWPPGFGSQLNSFRFLLAEHSSALIVRGFIIVIFFTFFHHLFFFSFLLSTSCKFSFLCHSFLLRIICLGTAVDDYKPSSLFDTLCFSSAIHSIRRFLPTA